jgi:hypothetical protein
VKNTSKVVHPCRKASSAPVLAFSQLRGTDDIGMTHAMGK